jgi:hypothetical protein
MKPERILLGVVTALLLAGVAAWALGGPAAFRSVSIWLWLGAFGVMCLPLVLWLADVVWRAIRR